MYRALVVVGLVVPALSAQAQNQPEPQPSSLRETLQHEIDHQVVRWQLGLRDMLHHASDRFYAFASSFGISVPDVTVLTAKPLPESPDSWATSGFGWRDDPIRHTRKFHSGADVRAKSGTPVMAAGDGVVSFAGRQGGYGNVIYVDHGGGVVTRYAHLRRIETKKNAVITAGTRIGQVGSTGRATGPHLHFEVRIEGHPVAPATALTVAQLQRESPAEGMLAAYALTPELQALELSDLDPPKGRATRTAKKKSTESRPERSGRTKRVRPTS